MIGAVQEELRAANEAFDRSQAVLGAQMEGHVAALRSLAAEVWLGLEALAERFDLHLGTIADSVSRR
jgi:hypothetical protein